MVVCHSALNIFFFTPDNNSFMWSSLAKVSCFADSEFLPASAIRAFIKAKLYNNYCLCCSTSILDITLESLLLLLLKAKLYICTTNLWRPMFRPDLPWMVYGWKCPIVVTYMGEQCYFVVTDCGNCTLHSDCCRESKRSLFLQSLTRVLWFQCLMGSWWVCVDTEGCWTDVKLFQL